MIDLNVITKRISFDFPTRSLIPVLVPLFLIVSSSVYPAIISSIENKEMKMTAEVLAQLNDNNIDTSDLHSTMSFSSSQDVMPSSPTPIGPTLSAAPSASKESSDTPTTIQQKDEGEEMMDIKSISSGKAVHTVWVDNTSGNFDILYKRDGADYDPTTLNLSKNAGSSTDAKIAVSGNNVYVVWDDFTPGNSDIFYRRSFDGGATFDPIINLSNNAGQSTRPAIAISGNNVYVVWDDNTSVNFDIIYKRSTDGGASFTEPSKNLSGNAGSSFRSAIAVSGNNVHVVWQDDTLGNSDIFYRRSTDSGATFPNVIKNLSSNAGTSQLPAIAASGNNVHVVWPDDTALNFDILYRRSTDGGTTFPNVIKNLSSNTGLSSSPEIALSSNNVYVVWQDDTPGNIDIFYRRSTDGGDSFTELIKNLSSNTRSSFSPAIALSSSNVYVVWQDITLGNFDILYRTSLDNGATFPSLLTNLSVNDGDSDSPAIAAS